MQARKNMRSVSIAAICTAFVLLAGSPVVAQRGALEIHNQPNYVAAAIALVPDYIGSDDYTIGAAPAGRFTFRGNREIRLVATTLTSNLLDHEFLRIGPAINYRFGRDSVDDQLVSRMRDIDDAVEVGVSLGLDFSNDNQPRYRFSVFIDFLHDVSDVHDGYLVTSTMKYWRPLGLAWDFGIQGSFSYGSSGYMNTYFGIDATDSARSGLAQFSAGAGLRDATITPVLIFHFSRKWHLGGFVRYQRILSDAADSPIVGQRGNANQFLVGLGTAYSW